MLFLLRTISLRHLARAPLRSLLTIAGVAAGVATMTGVEVVNGTVIAAFRSTVETIAGRADLTVTASARGFEESMLDQVRAVPGVAHASAGLTVVAGVAGSPGESLFVMGVDLLDDGYFRTYQAV